MAHNQGVQEAAEIAREAQQQASSERFMANWHRDAGSGSDALEAEQAADDCDRIEEAASHGLLS